jgi:hypothetical protein
MTVSTSHGVRLSVDFMTVNKDDDNDELKLTMSLRTMIRKRMGVKLTFYEVYVSESYVILLFLNE